MRRVTSMRGPVRVDAERAPLHPSAEYGALEVVKPSRAFEIRERVRIRRDQALELRVYGELPADHRHERQVVPLQHAEEGGHFAAAVRSPRGAGPMAAGRRSRPCPRRAQSRSVAGSTRGKGNDAASGVPLVALVRGGAGEGVDWTLAHARE